MISVYAQYYTPVPGHPVLNNGGIETLLFTIPTQNGSQPPFLSATVKSEMGSAGNFEFTVDPKSDLYNIWNHMKTLVRVDYDGDTIFYGRVATIDRDMFRSRSIHCEGAFTFFNDSVFEGTKKGYTITVNEYLTKLIDAHNECMDPSPEKKIYLGEVPGNYSESITDIQQVKNDTQKFANSQGYKTVKEWLESLVTDYGGFMRIRYSGGYMYLDWLKLYFNATESDQVMSVDSNVVDLSDTVEVDNIFTYVIPVGKNNTYIDKSESSSSGNNNGEGGEGGEGGDNGENEGGGIDIGDPTEV